MTKRYTDSADTFERSSEQAAKLVGQFVSMANNFGQSVRESMNASTDATGNKANKLNEAGNYVRTMRTAAGYSIEDFATAMGVSREQASRKLNDAENGIAPFPREWLAKAAETLGADPLEFYTRFQGCYPEENSVSEKPRAAQLAEIFETDSTLNDLSDDQFDALLSAVQQHYTSARRLVEA